MQVMTEEQYLSSRGASFANMGESGIHMTHRKFSPKQWNKIVNRQSAADCDLILRRAELRAEYAAKIAAGELRAPTRRESLEIAAAGHPDNPSVQAARRILARISA